MKKSGFTAHFGREPCRKGEHILKKFIFKKILNNLKNLGPFLVPSDRCSGVRFRLLNLSYLRLHSHKHIVHHAVF